MIELLKRALQNMGYRHMNHAVWGKPVGYHLLTIKIDEPALKICNYFKGANGKVLCWDSAKIVPDEFGYYEESIKCAEYSIAKFEFDNASKFEFLTIEQQYEGIIQ